MESNEYHKNDMGPGAADFLVKGLVGLFMVCAMVAVTALVSFPKWALKRLTRALRAKRTGNP